jgi:hypothetical protein
MHKVFLKLTVLIALVIFLIGGGIKGFGSKKVDFNDPAAAAKAGDKFAKECFSGLEKKYVKLGREVAVREKNNFTKACGCMWNGVVAAGKKRKKPMTLSQLQDELKTDAVYDAAIGRCAVLYPVLPE